ncbi:MAG TPA: ribbon-helix-helix protein, CopG family [Motilibacterales bacterium]|nr:ribbon-helix-helix protein, CopG family [Motilibacterales bacterium]
MKTTLVLDDALVDRVRERAKERGVTMSSVVEEAIVRMLAEPPVPATWQPIDLPSFPMGPFLVDITDREALFDALDDPEGLARYRGER